MSAVMSNIIIILIVLALVTLACWYIYKAKKDGARCIGCPKCSKCGGNMQDASGGCQQKA